MLEGEIREIKLVERLIEMWREHFTGALRFENDGIIKIIYFKEGDVLSASTNDRADSVDEILMRAGKVSREHVKQALSKRKENETLGDALLGLGFITRKELSWGRRVQVINVIRSISEWTAGSFTIVADYLPKREEGTIFSLPQIIVELIVTDQDRPKFEKLLDSGSAVFAKGPDFEQSFKQLGLNQDAEAIVAQADGQRAATEVAAAAGQEAFNSFKLLHALSLLGILRRTEVAAPLAVSTDQFESAGVADAADAWSGEMPKFDLADESPVAVPSEPQMPAWDLPPGEATPVVAPAPEPPAEPAEEPHWGLEAAPVEPPPEPLKKTYTPPPPVPPPSPIPTPPARRTTMGGTSTSTQRKSPLKQPPRPKKSRFGVVIALMVIFIVGGGVYFGFNWWKGREEAQAAVQPVSRPRRPHIEPPPPPSPTPTATTASVAPTPTPPRATATVAPPRVVPPTPAPRTGDVRERYEAMAREFAATATGNFTVQFAIVCEPSNVTKALKTGDTNIWFVPISIKERSCYRLYWGHYATREEAERALPSLPSALRESKPAVVPISR